MVWCDGVGLGCCEGVMVRGCDGVSMSLIHTLFIHFSFIYLYCLYLTHSCTLDPLLIIHSPHSLSLPPWHVYTCVWSGLGDFLPVVVDTTTGGEVS